MVNEDLGKTPLSPRGNCRFDSTLASPNPQSQQMISLACTTDSVLLAFMNKYKKKRSERLAKSRHQWWKHTYWNRRLRPHRTTSENWEWCRPMYHTPMFKNMAVPSGQNVSVECFFLCSVKLNSIDGISLEKFYYISTRNGHESALFRLSLHKRLDRMTW